MAVFTGEKNEVLRVAGGGELEGCHPDNAKILNPYIFKCIGPLENWVQIVVTGERMCRTPRSKINQSNYRAG